MIRPTGPKPSPRHSQDRIDNDGHYEPGNLHWGTPEQQVHNQRSRCPPKSGIKGVYKNGHRFYAIIRIDGGTSTRLFHTADEAAAAYQEAARSRGVVMPANEAGAQFRGAGTIKWVKPRRLIISGRPVSLRSWKMISGICCNSWRPSWAFRRRS